MNGLWHQRSATYHRIRSTGAVVRRYRRRGPVIVSAINGKANFGVTGDTGDLGVLMQRDDLPFRVLTPAHFVDLAGELLGQQ